MANEAVGSLKNGDDDGTENVSQKVGVHAVSNFIAPFPTVLFYLLNVRLHVSAQEEKENRCLVYDVLHRT